MGYESRLYVVEKNDWWTGFDGKKRKYGEVVAMFNMCVAPDVSCKMRRYEPTDAFIISDDGNTTILEDKYGDALCEVPLEDAIRILEEAAKGETYRRFDPCIQLLKGFDPAKWHKLVVLHYGY